MAERLEFSIRKSVLCMEYNKNIDTLLFIGAALMICEYSCLTFFHKPLLPLNVLFKSHHITFCFFNFNSLIWLQWQYAILSVLYYGVTVNA